MELALQAAAVVLARAGVWGLEGVDVLHAATRAMVEPVGGEQQASPRAARRSIRQGGGP